MRNKILEQNSAQDLAGLQVDQLQKMRNGNITFEQVKWFNNLSFEQREELMGKSIKIIEHPKMKLQNSNVVIGALTEGINPLKHFTENEKVKYYLGDNFRKYVLNGAKSTNYIAPMNFSKHKFTEIIYDKEIIEHFHISESNGLMGKEMILWIIAFLTSKQSKGEEGILQINSYSTLIGYMLCNDGVVRAIRVIWNSSDSKWYCDCHDLGYWRAELEMLSRN